MYRILSILLVGLAWMPGWGRTVTDYFTDPEAPIPLLEAGMRLDMADYWQHGMRRATANTLGGTAAIDSVSADTTWMRFDITGQASGQLAMLDVGNKPVLMLIETLPLPMADSRVTFYDSDWCPLRKPPLAEAKLNDWLTPAGRADRRAVEDWLPFITAEADFDPVAGTLTLKRTIDEYYADPADKRRLEQWLLPSLTYTYDGRRFQPVKPLKTR